MRNALSRLALAAILLSTTLGASRAEPLIDIDDVVAPTKNLVFDGDFEPPGAGRWVSKGIALDDVTKVAGGHSLHVRGSKEDAVRHDQFVDLEAGQTYTLSAWLKSEALAKHSSGTDRIGPGLMVIDAGWHWQIRLGPEQATSDWRRYSVTFQAPPTRHYAKQSYNVLVYLPKGETGRLWIDGLQLERGPSATAFTPKSIPDLLHVLETVNKADPVLQGIKSAVERLTDDAGPGTAILDRLGRMQKELEVAADRARGFEHTSGDDWRQTVAAVKQISTELPEMGWTTWWTNPWQRYSREQAPKVLEHADETYLKLAVNDYAPLALMITNLSGTSLEIQVRLMLDGQRSRLLAGPAWATLRQARMVSAVPGWQAEYPTLLAKLDEGQVVTVGSAETRQLWIDVDTSGLKPGIYRSSLELTPYQDFNSHIVPVVLEVAPVILPEKCPAEVFCFGLNPLEGLGEKADMPQEEINRIQDPWLTDLTRHGVNRLFHHTQYFKPEFRQDGTLAKPLDFGTHDKMLVSKRRYLDKFAGGYSVAHYHMPRAPNETFRRRFGSFLRAWLFHLHGLGLMPEGFPLELIDEPSGETLEKNRVAYEVLKQVAPTWKTMAAISARGPDQLETVLPIIDIPVVSPDLTAAADRVLRESGKEIWTYVCEGTLENLDPYRYYRMLPWKTWSKGYNGFGFYWATYGVEFQSPRQNQYSHYYFGTEGPIPSRGWQAFWRGTRDWTYLHTLRAAIARAQEQGATGAAKRAQEVIDQAVRDVLATPDDTDLADQWRLRMLDQLQTLQTNQR